MQLNFEQQEAVHHLSGPLLVLAGAGSGKTKVITQKIVYLLKEQQIKPSKILALTFTNKAAKEMSSRVKDILNNENSRGLIITTFHSFGLRFIQQEYKLLDLSVSPSIYDNADSVSLLNEISESYNIKVENNMAMYYSTISNWKNQAILPQDAFKIAKDNFEYTAANLYSHYQELLTKYNAVDFDDLILQPLILLEKNNAVKEKWQNKFYHVLVDEYQDTNYSQYRLLKLLTGPEARFSVVGDDYQSIYTWRGASPQNIKLLHNDYPLLKIIKLEQNYRSTNTILQAANGLIENNNSNLFPKVLWSSLGQGLNIKVLSCEGAEDEADSVANEIMQLKFTHNSSYKDIAILYRSNHQARVLEKALRNYHIPYVVSGGISFFNRTEIKDLVAYLKLINNLEDDAAFLRVANIPRRGLGAATLLSLKNYADKRNSSLFAASHELGLKESLNAKAYAMLKDFIDLVSTIREQSQDLPGDKLILELIKIIDYQLWLQDSSPNPQAAEKKWKNVKEFVSWCGYLVNKDEEQEPLTLSDLLNKLMLLDILDKQQQDATDECVKLMTIHTAKGLEFSRVILVGMEEDILPHHNNLDEDTIEEERRLAYVAITRAKHQLIITYCNKRKKAGQIQVISPSRFIAEIPDKFLDFIGEETKTKSTGVSHLESIKKMLREGSD